MRREQIALDAIRQKFQRIGIGALLLPCQTSGQPAWQMLARNRHRLDHGRYRFKRAKPFGLFHLPIHLRQQHQGNGILGQALAVFFECRTALLAGLAARNSHFHQAQRGEQRQGIAGAEQTAPVETWFGGEYFALAVAGIARDFT